MPVPESRAGDNLFRGQPYRLSVDPAWDACWACFLKGHARGFLAYICHSCGGRLHRPRRHLCFVVVALSKTAGGDGSRISEDSFATDLVRIPWRVIFYLTRSRIRHNNCRVLWIILDPVQLWLNTDFWCLYIFKLTFTVCIQFDGEKIIVKH